MSQVSPEENLELVSLAAAGDRRAQRALVERLRRRVQSISLSIMGNAADAEDTTQTILMEILKSAGSFRGESLFGWADRIAARTAIRHARQRRVRAMHFEARSDFDDVSDATEASSSHEELPRSILDYLALLPDTRRVPLVLRHVLDYSIEEIAELTEVSQNTVKDRLLHGRSQIRRLIRRDLATQAMGVAR
jgi:RNA polymerase sigma-70 factor, ECF subfamily